MLVVDDEPQVRATIREALEYEGYEVGEAANGAEALEAITLSPPDVIVLDLWMPVMDGWEFRRAQLATAPRIRVVVMSALSASDQRVAELNADALVEKPFGLDTLFSAVAGMAGPP